MGGEGAVHRPNVQCIEYSVEASAKAVLPFLSIRNHALFGGHSPG
ncbi:hypothetical protein CLV75_4232 [Ruegeria conchae]|uniref:Uncharacterized protein n=1 Tax=Ruegeria conchae TaxID=981384 RepID=A0A497YT52_9RHOB|nr:hypothetical protein CLV75_4232 [Ruegeria conchae]